MKFRISEFGCPVNGDKQIKSSFFGINFSGINVEVANRILLELFLDWLFANVGQTTDAVPLQTAMQT
jgi:hypothetical protein